MAFLFVFPAWLAHLATDKYGRIDPVRHLRLRQRGIWLRVFLNGEDITNRCRVADDRGGYATLVKLRDGRPYVRKNGELAVETRRGAVSFKRVEPWRAA